MVVLSQLKHHSGRSKHAIKSTNSLELVQHTSREKPHQKYHHTGAKYSHTSSKKNLSRFFLEHLRSKGVPGSADVEEAVKSCLSNAFNLKRQNDQP